MTRDALIHRCWAEINLSALRENLLWIRHQVGPNVQILTVVKADAYGHGLRETAALLMQSGTDVFGVANLVEAQTIRRVGKGWPILMLGAALPEEIEPMVKEDIMATVSTIEECKKFSAAALSCHRTARLHLKVDTGMGRLGAPFKMATQVASALSKLPGIRLEGLFTHYASVEEDDSFSRLQSRRFRKCITELQALGIQVPVIHANNSGAILRHRETLFNLVRPGLLVYGLAPRSNNLLMHMHQKVVRPGSDLQQYLQPALSLKSRVSLIREISMGGSLSYGRTFFAPKRMRIAVVSAGYGDGYPWSASNRAEVLIGGHRCGVVGRITMDQLLADVSRVPTVEVGDEVVLIGKQGSETIDVHTVARWAKTIPWEILTNIHYRVPRLYRGGQAS